MLVPLVREVKRFVAAGPLCGDGQPTRLTHKQIPVVGAYRTEAGTFLVTDLVAAVRLSH